MIAGADEAGRGPLAGPVVGAAVILPKRYRNKEIRDSKQLCAEAREELVIEIKRVAVGYAVVAVGHHRIRRMNIREAARSAMSLAVKRLVGRCEISTVLVDGDMPLAIPCDQRCVIGGDALHIQISAASILAKVWHDQLMLTLDERFPVYGFKAHLGYGTARHREALREHGPCAVHRHTFKGVREFAPSAQLSLFEVEISN